MIALQVVQTGLLAFLVGYIVRDIRAARKYRRDALAVQDARLDADLAVWARVAGRKRGVVASGGDTEQEQPGDGEHSEDFAHQHIVTSGTDGPVA